MSNYKRGNLSKEQRELIAGLLREDQAKAEDYLRLCMECPSDTMETNEHEFCAREEAERKRNIAEYLEGKDEGHEWNEPFIAGYLQSYVVEKCKAIDAEINEGMKELHELLSEDGEPDKERVTQLNEKCRKKIQLRTMIASKTIW